jgi:hypothetical protein
MYLGPFLRIFPATTHLIKRLPSSTWSRNVKAAKSFFLRGIFIRVLYKADAIVKP